MSIEYVKHLAEGLAPGGIQHVAARMNNTYFGEDGTLFLSSGEAVHKHGPCEGLRLSSWVERNPSTEPWADTFPRAWSYQVLHLPSVLPVPEPSQLPPLPCHFYLIRPNSKTPNSLQLVPPAAAPFLPPFPAKRLKRVIETGRACPASSSLF